MKFEITSDYTYPWPVEVKKPHPETPGETVSQEFVMTFRQLPQAEAEEIDTIRDEIAGMEEGAERSRRFRDHEHEMLRRVCIGWNDDVIGDDGNALPFTAQTFEAALQDVYFRTAVYRAYFASITLDGGRLGN